MTRKIYLAARYSRHPELQGYAADLAERGHRVTSRWINGNHDYSDTGQGVEGHEAFATQLAEEDWHDVMSADTMICFTEAPRTTATRGGRHVEFGMALAYNLDIAIVGPRENVFHHLPGLWLYDTWAELLKGTWL